MKRLGKIVTSLFVALLLMGEVFCINQIFLPEAQVCQVDADCVEAPAGCCGCNNGGESVAINRKYLSQWMLSLALSCGGGGACLTVYLCDDYGAPYCDRKVCVLPLVEPEPVL